jgi:osmoprotectant transport system substrate-binding protein
VARLRTLIALAAVGSVALAACGGDGDAASTSTVDLIEFSTVNIIATDTPESQLLAEIYAQSLENQSFRVGRKDPVSSRAEAYARVSDGRADITPELTASLLAFVADAEGGDAAATEIPVDAAEQIATLGELLPDTLTVGDPSPVDASGVLACSTSAVEQWSLATVADLAKVAGEARIAGPAGFDTAAPYGLAGYGEAYDTEFPGFVESADPAAAVVAGDADCAAVRRTDAAIVLDALLALDEDETAVPEDALVALIRAEKATSELLAVLSQVDAGLTTEVVRALLVKVERNGGSYQVVATEYLSSRSGG